MSCGQCPPELDSAIRNPGKRCRAHTSKKGYSDGNVQCQTCFPTCRAATLAESDGKACLKCPLVSNVQGIYELVWWNENMCCKVVIPHGDELDICACPSRPEVAAPVAHAHPRTVGPLGRSGTALVLPTLSGPVGRWCACGCRRRFAVLESVTMVAERATMGQMHNCHSTRRSMLGCIVNHVLVWPTSTRWAGCRSPRSFRHAVACPLGVRPERWLAKLDDCGGNEAQRARPSEKREGRVRKRIRRKRERPREAVVCHVDV